MGIPTTRFVSTPADNLLCAVCLDDVLEDPCSLNCGHSFCKGCIDQFQQSSCPTCRKAGAKETAHPAFVVRDIIGDLEVRCQYCVNDSSSEPAAKRQKVVEIDDEGLSVDQGLPWWNAIVSRLTGYHLVKDGDPGVGGSESELEDEPKPSAKRARDVVGCTWTGKLNELDAHVNNDCQYHNVPCSVEGCTVHCARKDMGRHMQESMLAHVDLIADSKVAKLAAKAKEAENRFNMKLNAMQRAFDAKVAALESRAAPGENTAAQSGPDGANDGPPVHIVVVNAGSSIVNGTYDYVRDGARDRVMEGSFMYAKEVTWEGGPATLYIYRYNYDPTPWYISVVPEGESLNDGAEIDLYQCQVPSSTGGGPDMLPPQTGWEPFGSYGSFPAPTLQLSAVP